MAVTGGRFVTIEGGDGVGKSTNIEFIANKLRQSNISFIETREPGGTALAEEIRQLLLRQREERVAENTELLLMFAARAQHIDKVIKPALVEGKWVLCDRFTDSTFAYQGGGRGIDESKISNLAALVHSDLQPDFTLLFDAPIDVALSRVSSRGEKDRIDGEQKEFFINVRSTYLKLAKENSHRFRVIDASQSLDEVQLALGLVVDEMIASGQNSELRG